MLHDQYLAPTRKDALRALNLFAFYEFPAAHWLHLRTTNPIESTFATVRLRHRKTKGCGTRKATLAMVYKLCGEAKKGWRKLTGFALLHLVETGVKFVNGEQVKDEAA